MGATDGRTIAPTSVDFDLHRIALGLYREARARPLRIRLLGLQLAKLRLDDVQLGLFDEDKRRSSAVDQIRDKFGYDVVHVASTLRRKS